MDYEEQLDIIRNFDPSTATHYNFGDNTECYFAVILKDGLIDITKYPSGRIRIDIKYKDEHILCFRRIYNRTTKKITLYLRQKVESELVNEKDKELYQYILDNCIVSFAM